MAELLLINRRDLDDDYENLFEIRAPSSKSFRFDSLDSLKLFIVSLLTRKDKQFYYCHEINKTKHQLLNEAKSIDQYMNYVQQLTKRLRTEGAGDRIPTMKIYVVSRKTFSFSDIVPIFTNNVAEKDACNFGKSFSHNFGEIKSIFNESYLSDEESSLDKNATDIYDSNDCGMLNINRQSARVVMESLKKGSTITMVDSAGNYYNISYRNDQSLDYPKFGNAVWNKETDTSFKCASMSIPVKILQNEIAFMFRQTDLNINDWKKTLENKEECPVRVNESNDTYAKEKNADEFVQKKAFDQILDEFKKTLIEEVHATVEESLKNCRISATEVESATVAEIQQNDGAIESSDEEAIPSATVVDVHEKAKIDINNRKNKIGIAPPSAGWKMSKKDATNVQSGRLKALAKRSSSHHKREYSKIVEVNWDLYVLSKSGFKLKMAPHSSRTVSLSFIKYGKYINANLKLELIPLLINTGIECSVMPFKKVAATNQTHDILFSTTGKTGNFFYLLKVMEGKNVCGEFRMEVRVRKYYQPDADYFSAEETLVPPASQVASSSRSPIASSELRCARDATADLADEGIGCVGDETDWKLSDSDLDVIEDKADNVNDEGIDTGFVKDDLLMAYLSDEDSDSSVSLLLDENEVREKVDDECVVQLPTCFIPNVEMKKGTVPVRIKRKASGPKHDLRRKDSSGSSKQCSGGGRSPHPRSYFDKDELLRPPLNGPLFRKYRESLKNNSTRKMVTKPHVYVVPHCDAKTDSTSNTANASPAVTKRLPSCCATLRHCDAKTDSTPDTANASSAKPTLTSVSTQLPTADTTTESRKNENGISQMENEWSATPPSKETLPLKEAPPSISIIPDKVLEMTSNVFKSVMNSVKPLNVNVNEIKDKLQKGQVEKALESVTPLLENVERTTSQAIADVHSLLNGGAIPTTSATELASASPKNATVHKSTDTVDATAHKSTETVGDSWGGVFENKPNQWNEWNDRWNDDKEWDNNWGSSARPQTPFGAMKFLNEKWETDSEASRIVGIKTARRPVDLSTTGESWCGGMPKNVEENRGGSTTKSYGTNREDRSRGFQRVYQPEYSDPYSCCKTSTPTYNAGSSATPFYTQPSFTGQGGYAAGSSATPFYMHPSYADWWGQPQTHSYPPPPHNTQHTVHPVYPMPTSATMTVPSQSAMTTAATQAEVQPVAANLSSKPETATTNLTSTQKPKQTNTSEVDEKYNEIPPFIREQLLKLNEMGFNNEERNLFFIRQYPKDLGKVIESLVNFSDVCDREPLNKW